jgi:hypothetical protein
MSRNWEVQIPQLTNLIEMNTALGLTDNIDISSLSISCSNDNQLLIVTPSGIFNGSLNNDTRVWKVSTRTSDHRSITWLI